MDKILIKGLNGELTKELEELEFELGWGLYRELNMELHRELDGELVNLIEL